MPDTRLRAWEGGLKGRLVRVARAARKRAVEATSSAIFLTRRGLSSAPKFCESACLVVIAF